MPDSGAVPNVFTGGIDFRLAGNGGTDCVNFLDVWRRAIESLLAFAICYCKMFHQFCCIWLFLTSFCLKLILHFWFCLSSSLDILWVPSADPAKRDQHCPERSWGQASPPYPALSGLWSGDWVQIRHPVPCFHLEPLSLDHSFAGTFVNIAIFVPCNQGDGLR